MAHRKIVLTTLVGAATAMLVAIGIKKSSEREKYSFFENNPIVVRHGKREAKVKPIVTIVNGTDKNSRAKVFPPPNDDLEIVKASTLKVVEKHQEQIVSYKFDGVVDRLLDRKGLLALMKGSLSVELHKLSPLKFNIGIEYVDEEEDAA